SGQNMQQSARNGTPPYGDAEWANIFPAGTDQFIFMEDCYLNNSQGGPTVPEGWDSEWGGKYVIRYCWLFDVELLNHGTDSSGRWRGGRGVEMYNNEFQWDFPGALDGIRSGTLIVHDNLFYGVKKSGWCMHTYRYFHNFGGSVFGGAWGGNAWDQNDPANPYVIGILTAASNNQGNITLTDNSKNWVANQWKGYVLSRTSDRMECLIDSNTRNSVFGTDGGFGGINFRVG